MTDDLILLASAYLDGEATPDERALVEADPSLLEEVERLRTARTALLDAGGFERPGDDAREAAIAAALTAWDFAAFEPTGSTAGSSPAVSSVSSGPAVVPFVRRHSYSARWLAAAAAFAAVAALGVVVAQFGGGEGSDDSAAFDAATADTELSAESRTEFEQIESPAGTDGALLSGGDDSADEATPDAAAQAASDADVAGAVDAPSAAPEETAALESAAVPEASLESPEELGVFAADAKTAAENDLERDTLARPCREAEFDEIDTYVATGTYLGRPVVIGIDDERGRAFAVDPDTCEIVAEAPLPSSG